MEQNIKKFQKNVLKMLLRNIGFFIDRKNVIYCLFNIKLVNPDSGLLKREYKCEGELSNSLFFYFIFNRGCKMNFDTNVIHFFSLFFALIQQNTYKFSL
jgi:hypothetical protein